MNGAGTQRPTLGNRERSFEDFGSTLIRSWSRMLAGLGLAGSLVGVIYGLVTPRVYVSTATFIPQSSDNAMSGLELAASQFGIRVPTAGGMWGSPVYVELLRSRMLLEPIGLDTLAVPEQDGRRIAVMDLFDVPELPLPERTERTVAALRKAITADEEKKLSGVRLTITTEWPSVSLTLADRLVSAVNQFNLSTRKSQATAERQFAETQASEAERALRESEDRLQAFLQRNRSIDGSPELRFAQDRLQRDITLRQSVFTALTQKREEARIKEVRDTPVLTILETPRLAATGQSRRLVVKAVFGGFVALLIGMAIAFAREGMIGALRSAWSAPR